MGWDLKQWERVVSDFLVEVGKGGEMRIVRDLRRMASDGHMYRGNTRPLGHGIFELKVTHDGKAFRLMYVHHGGTAVFLVCFEKKTQKTPKGKLELAQKRYASLLKQEVNLGNLKFH